LPPLRCLPQPRLPRHYLPPNRVRHKIGTDHLSRPPRVAICSPPPPPPRGAPRGPGVAAQRARGARAGRVGAPPAAPAARGRPPRTLAPRPGRAAPRRRLGRPDRPRRPRWSHRPRGPHLPRGPRRRGADHRTDAPGRRPRARRRTERVSLAARDVAETGWTWR